MLLTSSICPQIDLIFSGNSAQQVNSLIFYLWSTSLLLLCRCSVELKRISLLTGTQFFLCFLMQQNTNVLFSLRGPNSNVLCSPWAPNSNVLSSPCGPNFKCSVLALCTKISVQGSTSSRLEIRLPVFSINLANHPPPKYVEVSKDNHNRCLSTYIKHLDLQTLLLFTWSTTN